MNPVERKGGQLHRKREKFAVEIRREIRSRMFEDIRKKRLMVSLQSISIPQLLKAFELNSGVPEKDCEGRAVDLHEKDPLIFVKILRVRRDSLLRICFVSAEMMDEKYLKEDLDGTKEHPELPKKYPFEIMAMFWNSVTRDIHAHERVYEAELAQLCQFFMDFMQRNRYKETLRQQSYHLAVIGALEQLTAIAADKDFLKGVLKWIQGTESLVLMYNCLTTLSEEFWHIENYDYMYEIVISGLSAHSRRKQFEAVDVLNALVRRADYDDIESLLLHKPLALNNLLVLIDRNLNMTDEQFLDGLDFESSNSEDDRENVKVRKERELRMATAIETIEYMINSYEEYRLRCMREGVGYIVARLICSHNSDENYGGLRLFIGLLEEESSEVVPFMLRSISIIETGMWSRLGSEKLISHSSLDLRQEYSTLLLNLLVCSRFDELQQISDLICFELYRKCQGRDFDIVDLLIEFFIREDDLFILCNSLKSLKAAFSYCELESDTLKLEIEENAQYREDQVSTGPESDYNVPQRPKPEYYLAKIYKSSMFSKLKTLYSTFDQRNIEQSSSKMKPCEEHVELEELCEEFIDFLERD